MNSRIELLNQSILEFYGSIDEEIQIILVNFVTEYDVRFYFMVNKIDDELIETIEDVLHDILTDLGLNKDQLGNIIGYKYKIDYLFVDNITNSIEVIKDSYCIYVKKQSAFLIEKFRKTNLDLITLNESSLRVIINQACLGKLNVNENIIFNFNESKNELEINIKPNNLSFANELKIAIKNYFDLIYLNTEKAHDILVI